MNWLENFDRNTRSNALTSMVKVKSIEVMMQPAMITSSRCCHTLVCSLQSSDIAAGPGIRPWWVHPEDPEAVESGPKEVKWKALQGPFYVYILGAFEQLHDIRNKK